MHNLEIFIESYVFTHKLRKRRTVLRGHASFQKKLALTRVSMGFMFDWEREVVNRANAFAELPPISREWRFGMRRKH